MIAAHIEGATRILGKSQGFLGLAVRDEDLDGMHCLVTAWEPTPRELEALNNGAKVEIRILGPAHPPICVNVGKPPERMK